MQISNPQDNPPTPVGTGPDNPGHPDTTQPGNAGTTAASQPATQQQRSRIGKRLLSGFFDADVIKAWKALAVELDTTSQSLLAKAINNMLEEHGRKRMADEKPLARGAAAHQAREQKKPS